MGFLTLAVWYLNLEHEIACILTVDRPTCDARLVIWLLLLKHLTGTGDRDIVQIACEDLTYKHMIQKKIIITNFPKNSFSATPKYSFHY